MTLNGVGTSSRRLYGVQVRNMHYLSEALYVLLHQQCRDRSTPAEVCST